MRLKDNHTPELSLHARSFLGVEVWLVQSNPVNTDTDKAAISCCLFVNSSLEEHFL